MAGFLEDYEAELLAKAKQEIAAEDAAYAALPQSEKDRIQAEREAKFQGIPEEDELDDEEEEDDE